MEVAGSNPVKVAQRKESIMEEENDLARFLADPENVNAFVGIGVTQSLGYGLTEDGKWGKIEK